ncbi:biotin carboxylase N-terminal domain-containing protein [Hydrogenophaga sp.]|uniref:acetyl/propionyl/methylcrotonyl-CoA carboxylase subunit alpha n=1 Tax=Hydrogenophaga sp. TaxID=1904254 RepID=UPI0025C4F517|nr:biotin carboxylase N-terminal domain-containing protein [Hydrogenophaga sp.]
MKKLLIANRSEIARRVIRTAHAMGIDTVAVYSDVDLDALHVREAGSAVALQGNASADTYLRIDKLLHAARVSGADAVHPGYGFLSESADFAQAVTEAGLIWVGPPASAIRALGSKAAAKQLALAHGVPCLPGYHGEAQDDDRLQAEAQRIGLPLMVKAVAGGGGRGMRLVTEWTQLLPALKSARSEALSGFGCGELLLERALLRPRHVEVQVFADAHGHCIHLGERDCSVQRRHQKIIEESPSPAVSPELRAELGRCAVALAQAAGYVGAGTVEFLLDEEGPGFAAGPPQGETHPLGGQRPAERRSVGASFYLMEMNTRLQVEHPVTEMLTGLDLVEWQLRVARGEPLSWAQEQVQFHGHAIEVRLCAEDDHFTPHTGEVRQLHAPAESYGLRFDHALASGALVTPHYDAMLGKLIAHAATREAAIDRLLQGLRDTRVLGLQTNRALLAACLQHPVFRAGHARIDFLAQHGDELREGLALRDPALRAAAALAVCFDHANPAPALPCPYPRSLRLAWADGEITVGSVLELGAGQVRLTAEDGSVHLATVQAGGASGRRVTLDGVDVWTHAVLADDRRWHVQLAEREVWLTDLSHAPAVAGGAEHAHRELRAPFNGKLLAVHAAAGQQVARGEPLLVIESMKLEHTLAAPRDGVVAEVLVVAGAQVAPGQLLLRLDH